MCILHLHKQTAECCWRNCTFMRKPLIFSSSCGVYFYFFSEQWFQTRGMLTKCRISFPSLCSQKIPLPVNHDWNTSPMRTPPDSPHGPCMHLYLLSHTPPLLGKWNVLKQTLSFCLDSVSTVSSASLKLCYFMCCLSSVSSLLLTSRVCQFFHPHEELLPKHPFLAPSSCFSLSLSVKLPGKPQLK